jgi:hypothetical protein
MGSIAVVNPEYAEVLLEHLELEITDELKKRLGSKRVELSILLDNKVLSPDQKAEFSNTSPYVIAYDGTDNYHLCIGYVEEDAKGKLIEKVESLAKVTKRVGEIKQKRLNGINKEIEHKEKAKELLQDEYDKMLADKRFLERDMPDLKAAAEHFSEQRNEAEEEYKKLVGKIEKLRRNFLIRLLFRIYKLESK